ncbi:MAG: hypothetical protein WCT12_04085, partial [Verrucomicrobiota bacterium]
EKCADCRRRLRFCRFLNRPERWKGADIEARFPGPGGVDFAEVINLFFMSGDAMIECERLTKRFGHFTAVDHLSFA